MKPNPVEFIELDTPQKWAYLKRYYDDAYRFFKARDRVVSEEEIDLCIAKFKEKPLPKIRKEIRLQEWKFKFDRDELGAAQGYFGRDCEDGDWDEVKTPHSYSYIPDNPIKYGRTFHDFFESGEGDIWYASYDNWYRRELEMEPVGDNQVVYLKFDSVNLVSDVWLNENPVMLGHLGLFPFEMEVTEEMKALTANRALIVVRAKAVVSNKSWMFYNGFQSAYVTPPYVSGKLHEDWKDEANPGIAGDARLLVLNQSHLQDGFLYTRDIGEGEAAMQCQISLRNTGWARFKGKVRVEISPWLPEETDVNQQVVEEVEILPMNDTTLDLSFVMHSPNLWSVEHPALYLAHIVLEDASGRDVDDLYETFGVRTIKIVGTNYYLNNEIIYPRGTHDICHYSGESIICPSDRIIVKDLLLHKKMGANCSRWPSDSRIHYKRIAEYCDQFGYMLAWAGYFEVWTVHPEMELYASRDVKAMVRSLRNSPSIIIWEMGDEPLLGVHHYRRYKWYELVYKLVQAEDATRPILPAGHFCGELWELFHQRAKNGGQTSQEILDDILKDFPIYNLELAYWDLHTTFMLFPVRPFREIFNQAKEAFAGRRLGILTEFGIDALPDLKNVVDIYGKFRWGANPYWNRDRKQDDLAFYGREITVDDWRETQASQALCLSNAIDYIREAPQVFAGFYFMMMIDYWTYYQGIVDANGHCKLAYFVAQNLCQPVMISGLHGNTVLVNGAWIEITISNLGPDIVDAALLVQVKDDTDQVVRTQSFAHLEIPGKVKVSSAGEMTLDGLEAGLYSIEYYLHDHTGAEIGKMLELFYI